jgi:hypothetical protein
MKVYRQDLAWGTQLTSAQNQGDSVESRWGPIIAVLAVSGIFELLPFRLRVFPTWTPYLAALLLLVPMLGTQLSRGKPSWVRAESTAIFLFVGAAGVAIILILFRLIRAIIYHTPDIPPIPLLASTVGLWIFNIFVFALVYWQMDGGGPSTRLIKGRRPDLLFARSGHSEALEPGWRPKFIDYLFLAFTTSIAFSPTDTLPITSRAKILIMLQGFISLVTIVIVAARAVSTLR